MSKIFALAFILLCSAAWLQAQDAPSQGSQSMPPRAGATSGQTAVEGCLQGSNGTFTITDNTGTTYQLEGDSAKLSKHVGHQVQITGSTSGSGASSTNSSAGGSPTLTVSKVKHISASCANTSK